MSHRLPQTLVVLLDILDVSPSEPVRACIINDLVWVMCPSDRCPNTSTSLHITLYPIRANECRSRLTAGSLRSPCTHAKAYAHPNAHEHAQAFIGGAERNSPSSVVQIMILPSISSTLEPQVLISLNRLLDLSHCGTLDLICSRKEKPGKRRRCRSTQHFMMGTEHDGNPAPTCRH